VRDGGGDSRGGRGPRDDEDSLLALSIGYASAADARDGPAFADLFCAEGALVVPKYPDDLRPVITRSGREALTEVPEGLERFERTFHQVTNASFTLDGDRATGEVQCVAHHLLMAGDGSGPDPSWIDHVWFIRYRDGYTRTTAGWRIARRVLHLQWVEERAVERVGAPWPAPADAGPD
jgi:hypothetical protein